MSTQFERYQKDLHKHKQISVYYKLLIRYIERMEDLSLEKRIEYIEFFEREQERYNKILERSRKNAAQLSEMREKNLQKKLDIVFECIGYEYHPVEYYLSKCDIPITRSELIHYLAVLHKQGKIYRICLFKRSKSGSLKKGHTYYKRREYW